MIIGTLLPTVADTQRNHSRHCGLCDEPWSIDNHIEWYQHCKSRYDTAFHERRWGNHKASVSRNKREGKFVGVTRGKVIRNFDSRLFTFDFPPDSHRAYHGLRRRKIYSDIRRIPK